MMQLQPLTELPACIRESQSVNFALLYLHFRPKSPIKRVKHYPDRIMIVDLSGCGYTEEIGSVFLCKD